MSSPTSEQISDFIAFSCGASIEDAHKFLALTGNIVEHAVQLYFSATGPGAGPGSGSGTKGSGSGSGTKGSGSGSGTKGSGSSGIASKDNTDEYGFSYDYDDDEEEEVREIIPVKRQRLLESNSTGQYLPGVQPHSTHRDKPVTSVFATGQSGKASAKHEMLAKMYSPPFDIMFQGNFDELRNHAKSKNKWILVNIQKEEEFSSHVLNRDVWNDESVKELLKYGFVFWQKYDTVSGATDFFRIYQIIPDVTVFPFIAIVDPLTKSLVKQLSQKNISETLGDFISENSTPTEYWERKSGSTVRQAVGAVEAPVQREATSSSLSTDLSGSSSGRVSVVNGSTKTANGSSVVSTVVGYKASEILEAIALSDPPMPMAEEDSKPKTCNIRLVLPSGQKSKESFTGNVETTLSEVLTRVLDRLPADDHDKRFDLVYGYPPKPLSKRLLELQSSESGTTPNSWLYLKVFTLGFNNETVTVRFTE